MKAQFLKLKRVEQAAKQPCMIIENNFFIDKT